MQYALVRKLGLIFIAIAALAGCGLSSDTSGQLSQDVTGTTISTDKSTYFTGEIVRVTFSGMPGNNLDWIAVSLAGSGNSFVKYHYTRGATSGTVTFSNLPAGDYEARAYQNNTYTLLASSPFTIKPAPIITTDKQQYTPGQTVTVSYSQMPGNPGDTIAVSLANSADTSTVQSFPTNGATSGTQQFVGLANGSYEARAYANGTQVIARWTFSIGGTVTVTPDSSSYTGGQTVNVSFSGMPGFAMDWIGISTVGSPDTSYVQFKYTNGAVSGTLAFTGLASGTYEARAYRNNSYTLLARSQPFTVSAATCTPPANPAVFGSITSGDITLDASTTQTTAGLTVPFASSILFTSVKENESSPQYGAVRCYLHDVDTTNNLPAGVTCRRVAAGTDNPSSNGVVTVHYTIATFTSGVTVQSGIANTATAADVSVTLSPAVDPNSSFVLLNGVLASGGGWGNNDFARGELTSGTTLDIRNAVSGETISWQVVTMAGATVQRGSVAFASGDTLKTVPVTSLPSGSILLDSYTSDNTTSVAASELMLQGRFSNSSTIELKRAAGGTNLDVSWEAISLPFATHDGTAAFAVGDTSSTTAVAGIAPASSVALSASQSILGASTGSTTYNGSLLDLVGEAAATLNISSGSVTATRGTATATATIPWTVIDFSKNCAGQ